MTFNSWLRKQRHRDDPVGDLARDYIDDCRLNRIRSRSVTSIRLIASGIGDVIDDAIAEYHLADKIPRLLDT
jgi:hypothetical protein